jgi:hypothetical protein
MTEYTEVVDKQRLIIEAEKWAKMPSQIHAFNTIDTAVWYDTRRTDGRVIDTHFNDGRIERELRPSGKKVKMGKKMSRSRLIHMFTRRNSK